jgi:hypothetical protein
MKRFVFVTALTILGAGPAYAQPPQQQQIPPAPAPVLGPAAPAPGVFTATKTGAANLRLRLAGKSFTGKQALENYLAWRAASETMANKFNWFSFTERRAAGDKVPVPKGDPAGPRFSFRMEFFRPHWRYKLAGSPAWRSWSPFSGAAFPALDPKTVTDYELTADIVMRRGMVDDVSPLAFDAGAVSDYLINQVETPK